MHTHFADWCHDADPTMTSETVQKRWAATDEIVKALDKAQAAQLAHFATSGQGDSPAVLAAYKRHDDTMRTRGVEEELRKMAGAVLHVACEHSPIATVAALSLLCSAFGFAGLPSWIHEHTRKAAATLSSTGRELRDWKGPQPLAEPPTAAAINAAFVDVRNAVSMHAEITDSLWWALTHYSNTLGTPYKAVPAPLAAIAAPVDLLSFVRRIPMAPEAETLLLHVLTAVVPIGDPPIAFRNYFTGIPREHVELLRRPLPDDCRRLCPVMWALGTVTDAKTWQDEFDRQFGFPVSEKVAIHALGLQHLRELCLARAFRE